MNLQFHSFNIRYIHQSKLQLEKFFESEVGEFRVTSRYMFRNLRFHHRGTTCGMLHTPMPTIQCRNSRKKTHVQSGTFFSDRCLRQGLYDTCAMGSVLHEALIALRAVFFKVPKRYVFFVQTFQEGVHTKWLHCDPFCMRFVLHIGLFFFQVPKRYMFLFQMSEADRLTRFGSGAACVA